MGKNGFKIMSQDDSISVCRNQNGQIFFTITNKQWETDFYGRKFGSLQIRNFDYLNKFNDKEIAESLYILMMSADTNNYDIIESHININYISIIPIIEEVGFRLVDTRITFMTLIKKEENELRPLSTKTIAYATLHDLDAINKLTNECLVENKSFYHRFKDERYFSKDEIVRYYHAWISNHIADKDTYFIVMKDNEKLFAYFIYKKSGFFEGVPLYKGILTAVHPDYRGNSYHLHMQAYLYKQFPEKQIYLDNTTQLTNVDTISNHIKSQKKLNRIVLTFFRRRDIQNIMNK
jgi:hypothetical protein